MMNFGFDTRGKSEASTSTTFLSYYMKNYFDNICISCGLSLCPSFRCEYLSGHLAEVRRSVFLNQNYSFHGNICSISRSRDWCCIGT